MARKRSKSAKAKTPAKRGRRTAPAASKGKRSVAAQVKAPSADEAEQAARRYARSLEERGEAVPAGEPLPPGATHEIVGREEDGTPVVKRRRFSAH